MNLKQTQELHGKIAAYITRHPEITFTTMSADFGVSQQMLSHIARKFGIVRRVASSKRINTVNPDLLAKLEG